MNSTAGKVIIFSAPSGSGKTTIINQLLKSIPNIEFSISATSRPPRGQEQNGLEYYFMPADEFRQRIAHGEFAEWEQVYTDKYYGTLKSEPERIWAAGKHVLFDVDVKGGLSLKAIYGDKALLVFIMPPSVEELRHRLVSRNTDSPEVIEERVSKAAEEIEIGKRYDKVVVNDQLEQAVAEAEQLVREFIAKN